MSRYIRIDRTPFDSTRKMWHKVDKIVFDQWFGAGLDELGVGAVQIAAHMHLLPTAVNNPNADPAEWTQAGMAVIPDKWDDQKKDTADLALSAVSGFAVNHLGKLGVRHV